MWLFSKNKKKYFDSIEWLSENSIHLKDPTECKLQDFEFLRKTLRNKRIVWIGENGHNIREHNIMKSKIIEFLHKEMNFKVLSFESGLVECFSSNYLKNSWTPTQLLTNSIYSLWATKENIPLFDLIKDSDLNLTGIDINPSSNREVFLKFVNSNEGLLPKEILKEIEHIESSVFEWYYKIGQYKAKRKKVPTEIVNDFNNFKKKASKLINNLEVYLNDQSKLYSKNQEISFQFKIISRCLKNRLYFIDHFDNNYRTYKKMREVMMKENLEWICNELYPNEKIIVWAHNLHIFKNYKTFTGFEPLGSIVSEKIKEESYYLGLFMYKGETMTDTGQPYKVSRAPKKSLEDYMHQVQSPTLFTDFLQIDEVPENKWIFNKTIFLESGTMQTLFKPRKQLDGVLFIEDISCPEYLKLNKKNV
ncbi:erythromycin esterase family protein [Priestia aryabhattai]|uniref:erythromycin esterase family protein n=1 Tax=Priestia aryabhattai TaxID=412384 RepID=UPI001CFCE7B1|nr:erythromycin esterase family protein [Priestia aryabhattai]